MLAAHHTSTAACGYARRQPETTVLYRVVRDHLPTLLDQALFGALNYSGREFTHYESR